MADVVLLNPTEGPETEVLQEKMKIRRAAAKESKKGKKRQNKSEAEASSTSTVTNTEALEGKQKMDSVPAVAAASSSSSNGVTSSNGLKGHPSRKAATDPLGPKDSKIPKILNGSYSVAKDPNASATYKSLFTSSEKAKDQQKAHWVTYNPFYN